MSIKAMARAWNVPDLNTLERLTLLALADFADDDGDCWPSTETLAARVIAGEEEVVAAVEALAAKGLVIVDRTSRHVDTIYRLTVPGA